MKICVISIHVCQKSEFMSVFPGYPGPFPMISLPGKIPSRDQTLKQTHNFGICIKIRKNENFENRASSC